MAIRRSRGTVGSVKKGSAKKGSAKGSAKKGSAKKGSAKKGSAKKGRELRGETQAKPRAGAPFDLDTPQTFLLEQLNSSAANRRAPTKLRFDKDELLRRLRKFDMRPPRRLEQYLAALHRIKPDAGVAEAKLPEEIQESLAALKPRLRRTHGLKVSLAYFPWWSLLSPCADKFGYSSPAAVRTLTKLPFNAATQALLGQLGALMGNPGRETGPDSLVPAGYTYVGQFVDHDITFDVSSSLDVSTDANTIHNMRTPALDLDSVYAGGPALQPYLYDFPSSGPATAIKLRLGTNLKSGIGGPAGTSAMLEQTNFDVPRIHDPLNPASSPHTAIIGDPRNDENLIVVQLHHAMLRLHNQVVDLLLLAGFAGDIFVEAKRIVTHHYQWAVMHDFLERICGKPTVDAALASVVAPINSPFRMPVEFAVAAYRFGHSMIRDRYWVNFNFPAASLGDVFAFNRNPNLPVRSNWVVDFNAFFDTGIPVPVNNKARPIDSVLATGLENLPGFVGMMQVLATRNLRRGLALGLPSGQGMANHFGVVPLSALELTQDLPADEVALLQGSGGLLLQKTPLWYYVLREAAVRGGGNSLGPVGGRIVAETFVRILKRDPSSYLNEPAGFVPFLPSATPGDFTFADLVNFAGVTEP